MRASRLLALRAIIPLFGAAMLAMACGGDEGTATPTPPAAGNSGAAGGASKPGSAGAAGSAGKTTGGNGGQAGSGGKAGGGGTAGTAGKAGSAGAAGGGMGKPGSACKVDGDCDLSGVETQPASCAEAFCNEGLCGIRSKDADGDSFRDKKCKLVSDSSVVITVGADCDDTNKDVNPKGWDGPAGEGKPNRCADGVDQDCSGADGDSVLANGASCSCTPGDVQDCAQTVGGSAIVFPGGKPAAGSECKLGKRTCAADVTTGGGKFGPCIGAVIPGPEVCDAGNKDEDCDGSSNEDDAIGKTEWVYDADSDGARASLPGADPQKPRTAFASKSACAKPAGVPAECTAAYCGSVPLAQCCPAGKWAPAIAATAIDCDDGDNAVRPGAAEICATKTRDKDDNCDGEKDEKPVAGEQVYYRDLDGDGFGDQKTASRQQCLPPGPEWKAGIPQTDCDDTTMAANPGVAQEDCLTPYDDNCNGTKRDGCTCSAGDQPEDCGAPTDCVYLPQASTCENGEFTACPTAVAEQVYCADVDNDKACTNECAAFCPSIAGSSMRAVAPPGYRLASVCAAVPDDCADDDDKIGPSRAEVCNGKDDDCSGTVDDLAGRGEGCDVLDKPIGACAGGGVRGCCLGLSGEPLCLKSESLQCLAKESGIGQQLPPEEFNPGYDDWADHPAPNGSSDWDCDGLGSLFFRDFYRPPTCGETPEKLCGHADSQATCQSSDYAARQHYTEIPSSGPGCFCWPDFCQPQIDSLSTCGGQLLDFSCVWQGGACRASDVVRPTFKQCTNCSARPSIQRCH